MKGQTRGSIVQIAAQLRQARLDQGRSLADVCAAMNGFVARPTLSGWEFGRVAPSVRHLEYWANALGYELTLVRIGSHQEAS